MKTVDKDGFNAWFKWYYSDEQTEKRRKNAGMVSKKIGGIKTWHYPLEFWTMTKDGLKLTEANRQRGVAALSYSGE